MTADRAVLAFAGVRVPISVLPTAPVAHMFVCSTMFIGLNLFQSASADLCPAARVFRKLGLSGSCALRTARPALASR